MQQVKKELQDQQNILESQRSALESQQQELEELKLSIKMNSFSEAGRVFDTVFKPPPTIEEEAEEELKEEQDQIVDQVFSATTWSFKATSVII